MTPDIVFLHTADVHVNTFNTLMAECFPDLTVKHIVYEQLLADAREDGLTADITQRIQTTMRDANAPVVVCTCSTIGGVAEATEGDKRFMRIDRAMADKAVTDGKRILVVATVDSTLEPTKELLAQSAKRLAKSPQIEMLLVEGAWAKFEAGDNDGYLQTIADTLQENWRGYDVIVLAQASMAQATSRSEGVDVPILSSPKLGVLAAGNALQN